MYIESVYFLILLKALHVSGAASYTQSSCECIENTLKLAAFDSIVMYSLVTGFLCRMPEFYARGIMTSRRSSTPSPTMLQMDNSNATYIFKNVALADTCRRVNAFIRRPCFNLPPLMKK